MGKVQAQVELTRRRRLSETVGVPVMP